jgi:ABC-type Zn uptake system ZnuABC Zn-binding protein ZnuA
MSIHISNKLFSNRSLLIACFVAVTFGFIFVNLLIFYFPRDNRIDLNGLDPTSIQPPTPATKNQVATTDLAVYNIAKLVAKDGLAVSFAADSKRLNQDFEFKDKAFSEIFGSKALITTGQDSWLTAKSDQLSKLEILDISKTVNLQTKSPAIDIGSSESNSGDSQGFDYNYLLDDNSLQLSINEISNFLSKIDLGNKDLYLKNQVELTAQINYAQAQFANIKLCNKTPIISNSQNLNYLAQQYGLELSVVNGFDPTKPELNQIQYLQQLAKNKNSTSLFIDKQIPLIDYTNLKNSLGLEVLYISDYLYPDIVDTLTKNLQNLKTSQNC